MHANLPQRQGPSRFLPLGQEIDGILGLSRDPGPGEAARGLSWDHGWELLRHETTRLDGPGEGALGLSPPVEPRLSANPRRSMRALGRRPADILRYASRVSKRAFARPGSEAPWQPSAADLADSRLARFVRAAQVAGSSDDDGLEAIQAQAVADPGWFWGAAADDLGSTGSAARRRSWTWPAARPGLAGGPAGRSTTRSRPPSRGPPRRPTRRPWPGRARTETSANSPGPSSTGRCASRLADSRRSGSGRGPGSGSFCRCWSRPPWR